jgi:hypothetical protein
MRQSDLPRVVKACCLFGIMPCPRQAWNAYRSQKGNHAYYCQQFNQRKSPIHTQTVVIAFKTADKINIALGLNRKMNFSGQKEPRN